MICPECNEGLDGYGPDWCVSHTDRQAALPNEGDDMPEYERITAEQIQPGDRVARARTHSFLTVSSVAVHEKSVVIYYDRGNDHRWRSGGMDRPRRTAKWWRETQ